MKLIITTLRKGRTKPTDEWEKFVTWQSLITKSSCLFSPRAGLRVLPGPARPCELGRWVLPPSAPGRASAGSFHVQSSLGRLSDLQRQTLAISVGRQPAHGWDCAFLDVVTSQHPGDLSRVLADLLFPARTVRSRRARGSHV